jgi:hypothetical protein
MKLTGAAILVSRGMKVLQAVPAAYPYRSASESIHRMTAESFAMAWGADSLIRLPAKAASALPLADGDFLVRAGLPALVRYSFGAGGNITFCRLSTGLAPLLSEKFVGPALPREWATYSVLGDEFFCNGSALWCIHRPTGRVDRIDVEIEPPVEFANSSVMQFAGALFAATEWSATRNTASDWQSEVGKLQTVLAELDPPCMGTGRSFFWSSYLDFLADAGPEVQVFERGSKCEGEQALRIGSW